MLTCCNYRNQRGDILLESLIGVLIVALIGGGIAHLSARLLDGQREAKVQQIALNQLHDTLLDGGVSLCGTTQPLTAPLQTQQAVVTCTNANPVALTINGNAYTVTPPSGITVTVDAAALGLSGSGTTNPPLTVGTQP
jgi:type II secretory pathway pseudopilin PulG